MGDESDTRARRERDMILAPNEYVYVSDETKGHVDIFTGPTKQSLSNTDQPVIFDEETKRFRKVLLEQAIQTVKTAPEGWYIVLKNPAKDGKRPNGQGKTSSADLLIGRKVNIPGPESFALWPGQMAKVLKGHHIRSNQYLLVRVYDEEAATKNWSNAIIKAQKPGDDSQAAAAAAAMAEAAKDPDFHIVGGETPELTMGKLLIIKGTDVSFYIPPTGVEVVPDENGNLVREAVTLGQLEYCLLYDEDGNKRYERGPAVVFPRPTEVFATRDAERDGRKEKTRKFKAIELNENSGIYVKVIAEYKEDDGTERKVGDELFITGKQQMIYFPREEHASVKYDGNEINFGIAIPAGEARYVLDRNKGNIRLENGPTIFLPDPRHEVIVRRILDVKACQLLYPGNQAAMAHNAALAGVDLSQYMSEAVSNAPVAAAIAAVALADASPMLGGFGIPGIYSNTVSDTAQARGLANAPAAKGFSGDHFQRHTQYTEPRTITLPTKFDGAVTVDVWTGYAVMLVRKSGEKRVVQGPKTVLLEYDETPQVLTLSTGKPKTMDNPRRDAFLLVKANKVSDIVQVETRDLCKLTVKLSYRVHFEGDPEKWFSVENYVKFLCDHMRSKLRNATMQYGVEDFYTHSTSILRDVVLGRPVDPQTGKVQERPGTAFEENGMRIYDVEILSVDIENKDVANLLTGAQREAISQALSLQSEQRKLDYTKQIEGIKQETTAARFETAAKELDLKVEEGKRKLLYDLATIEANAQTAAERHKLSLSSADGDLQLHAKKLDQVKAAKDLELHYQTAEADLRIKEIQAEVQAVVDRAKAVDPALISALNAFGERAMVEKIAEAMAPLSIIGGSKRSVTEILADMLKGTPFAKHLNGNGNGVQSAGQLPPAART